MQVYSSFYKRLKAFSNAIGPKTLIFSSINKVMLRSICKIGKDEDHEDEEMCQNVFRTQFSNAIISAD